MAKAFAAPPGFKVPPVKHAEIIRAGASRVWGALSTKRGWENWFCNRVLIDFRPGGYIHFRWKDFGVESFTGDSRADIVKVEARKRLVFTWQGNPIGPPTRVEFRLDPRGPITVVRVEETGWGDNVEAALANASGWGACLEWLKTWVEHGIRFDGTLVGTDGAATKASRARA